MALTLRDIARQAGGSVANVGRVLHNRPGVRPDIVRRVKEAERNAFQPDVAGAELARGRARRFAFQGMRLEHRCVRCSLLPRGEPMLSEGEKIRIDIVMRDNLP